MPRLTIQDLQQMKRDGKKIAGAFFGGDREELLHFGRFDHRIGA